MADETSKRLSFREFYATHYPEEHRNTANRVLHIIGTLAGIGLLGASVTVIPLAWALLFPIVHVGPGLIGHRLFERSADVGDVRILRTDFPAWWFLVANHMMTAEVLASPFKARSGGR